MKAALVGAGMISLYHLRAWESAGVPIVAICDTNRAAAEARARYCQIKLVRPLFPLQSFYGLGNSL